MTGLRVGRSRVRILLREKSLHQGVYRVAGVFPGGLTQNSHPSSADLKNVWRYTSTPLHSWRAYGLRLGIRDSKLQDSYTCRVWNLKVSFAIVITINRLRGWRAEWCGG